MACRIMQFRFYGDNNKNNYPSNISVNNLTDGTIFNSYLPIIQLGVQFNREESIMFYLNNSNDPILSHPYGLFELDLTDKTYIQALRFNLKDSSNKLMVSESSPLIVDIVYEG